MSVLIPVFVYVDISLVFSLSLSLSLSLTLSGELKGAYRVGAHAVGLLLRGECSVELVLMCANKPTYELFNEVATRLPAKFEVSWKYSTINITIGRREL